MYVRLWVEHSGAPLRETGMRGPVSGWGPVATPLGVVQTVRHACAWGGVDRVVRMGVNRGDMGRGGHAGTGVSDRPLTVSRTRMILLFY